MTKSSHQKSRSFLGDLLMKEFVISLIAQMNHRFQLTQI